MSLTAQERKKETYQNPNIVMILLKFSIKVSKVGIWPLFYIWLLCKSAKKRENDLFASLIAHIKVIPA